MVWFITNHTNTHCTQGSLTFQDNQGLEITVQRKNGKPKACMGKAS